MSKLPNRTLKFLCVWAKMSGNLFHLLPLKTPGLEPFVLCLWCWLVALKPAIDVIFGFFFPSLQWWIHFLDLMFLHLLFTVSYYRSHLLVAFYKSLFFPVNNSCLDNWYDKYVFFLSILMLVIHYKVYLRIAGKFKEKL